MEPQQPRKAARYKWSEAEIDFISTWYGKLPINDIARILGRDKERIQHACFRRGFKACKPLRASLTVTYKGKKYECVYTPPRYITKFNPDGSRICYDTKRATKAHKVLAKQKRKRIAKPEPVEVKLKPFEPNGKTLVKIDNKTWAYR